MARYLSVGDVNGDGEITPGDAVAAYEFSKKFEWTDEELRLADFNGDGQITPMDAVLIYEKNLRICVVSLMGN